MRLRALALLPLLAACAAPVTAPPPAPEGAADTCGAAPYARLTGQPATALERELILRPVRLVRPGEDAASARPERLTFHIATPPGTPADTPVRLAERITGVSCG